MDLMDKLSIGNMSNGDIICYYDTKERNNNGMLQGNPQGFLIKNDNESVCKMQLADDKNTVTISVINTMTEQEEPIAVLNFNQSKDFAQVFNRLFMQLNKSN